MVVRLRENRLSAPTLKASVRLDEDLSEVPTRVGKAQPKTIDIADLL